ncbi:MAG: hypothetical protein ACK2T4_05965 [Candidatus Promineifilaceae bacterium]|jgi:hypothetical protein
MTKKQTIKQLYGLALAEGEGVGTAYEYYAKRLVLLPWLARGKRPNSMLVAGLPEKYGSSLDLLLLGAEIGCKITVVDDRLPALTKLNQALKTLQGTNYLPSLNLQIIQTGDIISLPELNASFDLAASSEILQRLDPELRGDYVTRLQELAPRTALFAPNASNDSHVGISGLNGLQLEELIALMSLNNQSDTITGYIDMPPFPPGITRSEAQREEASTGKMEAFAMWGLGIYAHLEKYLPKAARRKWAHIVFAL